MIKINLIPFVSFYFVIWQEGVLNNLEMKVKEQDAYWRSIVQVKDNEIRSLKQNEIATT